MTEDVEVTAAATSERRLRTGTKHGESVLVELVGAIDVVDGDARVCVEAIDAFVIGVQREPTDRSGVGSAAGWVVLYCLDTKVGCFDA